MPNFGKIEDGVCTIIAVAESLSDLGEGWVEIPSDNSNAVTNASYNSQTGEWTAPEYIPTADQNKAQAKELLVASDWSQLEDVGLTQSSKEAFQTYRATLRQIVNNPTEGILDFPDKPTEEYV